MAGQKNINCCEISTTALPLTYALHNLQIHRILVVILAFFKWSIVAFACIEISSQQFKAIFHELGDSTFAVTDY